MKTILASSILALGVIVAAPAMAQGVYVGPGGVGVDTGVHPYGWDRDHDRNWRHRHDRGDGYYEGRSSYQDRYDDER